MIQRPRRVPPKSYEYPKDNTQSDIQVEKTPQKETIEPNRNDIPPKKPKTAEHPMSEAARANQQTGYRTRSGRQVVRPKYLKDYV